MVIVFKVLNGFFPRDEKGWEKQLLQETCQRQKQPAIYAGGNNKNIPNVVHKWGLRKINICKPYTYLYGVEGLFTIDPGIKKRNGKQPTRTNSRGLAQTNIGNQISVLWDNSLEPRFWSRSKDQFNLKKKVHCSIVQFLGQGNNSRRVIWSFQLQSSLVPFRLNSRSIT